MNFSGINSSASFSLRIGIILFFRCDECVLIGCIITLCLLILLARAILLMKFYSSNLQLFFNRIWRILVEQNNMKLPTTLILLTVFLVVFVYMKESGSCSSSSVEINIGAVSRNSSGILVWSKSSIYEPDLNCSIYLRPPLSYGLVVSVRNIDLKPYAENFEDCENYLELSPVEHYGSVKICGYSYDQFEYQSYTSWEGMRISLHTSNYTSQKTVSFQFTFTAVRSGNEGFCFKEEKRCRNHHCIWKSLACDGHNNCGDLSDEIDKYIAQCAALSPGESLAVILVTIIGSLILLFIAACLRGPKITQQIERLTRTSQTDSSTGATAAPNSSSRTVAPAVNRIRTNYGSTSQFLTSCDFSDMIYRDPPPRYEEIQSSSQAGVTVSPSSPSRLPAISTSISQVPVISSRISALPHIPGNLTRVSVPSTRVYVDSNPPGSFS